jgi:hypothetical protein
MIGDTKAWVALGIKQAIRQAIDAGVDGIVFGTGEQNANLYDLSKQISRVTYNAPGGKYANKYGTVLKAFDHKDNEVINKTATPEELEDYVGKEVAQRLLESQPDNMGRHSISGLDLKVGGEGMKAFYDKIVPQVANDVLKKLGGGKVWKVAFPGAEVERNGSYYGATLDGVTRKFSSYENAKEYLDKFGPEAAEQTGFEITDAMREKVNADGVPLFSLKRKTEAQMQADHAAMFGGDDPNAVQHAKLVMDSMPGVYAAARGYQSQKDTLDKAEALAKEIGYSVEDMQGLLARGGATVGNETIPAEVLVASAVLVTRYGVADLLANPAGPNFAGRLTEVLNIMLATRANISSIARALNIVGKMQKDAKMTPEERQAAVEKATKEAGKQAEDAVGLSENMDDTERAIVNEWNDTQTKVADAEYAAAEAQNDIISADQELEAKKAELEDARTRRDDAKRELSQAHAAIKKAEAATDNAVNKTPTPAEINQAEGNARRAANEAEAAKQALKNQLERMKAAEDRLARAQKDLAAVKAAPAPSATDIARAEQKAKMAEAEAALAKASLKAAQDKLRDAENRLKDAVAAKARFESKTPTPAEILKAQGDARRAEAAADQAHADYIVAKKELTKLLARQRAAIQRAIDAGNKLAGVRNKIAKMQKPMFVGKGGVSMDEIIAALGGKRGLDSIQRTLQKNAGKIDPMLMTLFLQGVAGRIHKTKAERAKRTGVWKAVHGLLAGLMEQFKAFILTGIFTHGINIAGNLMFLGLEMPITRAIKAFHDGGVKGVGQHYKAFGQALAQTVPMFIPALAYGMTQEYPAAHFNQLAVQSPAVQKVILDLGNNAWMDGISGAIDMANYDGPPGMRRALTNNITAPVIREWGKIVRTIGFAPLGAMDAAFKTVPYLYSVNLQKAQGKVVDYSEAVSLAEVAVFQAKLSEGMASFTRFVNSTPGAGFIVPFMKTLINLIGIAIDYTPVLGQIKYGIANNQTRDRGLAVGRGLLGLAFAALVMSLHGEGDDDEESVLSGRAPIDPNDRAIWSIKYDDMGLRVGDTITSLARLEPFSSSAALVIAGADAYRMMRDEYDSDKAANIVGSALGQLFIGKSFMATTKQMFEAAGSDTPGKFFFESLPTSILLGSTVPNMLPQLGDVFDPNKRQANTLEEKYIARLPWLRDSLPVAVDAFGQPTRNTRFGTILPIQPRPVIDKDTAKLVDWMLLNEIGLDQAKFLNEFPGDKAAALQSRRYLIEQKMGAGMTEPMRIKPGATPQEVYDAWVTNAEGKNRAKAEAAEAKSTWSSNSGIKNMKLQAIDDAMRKKADIPTNKELEDASKRSVK